jgi:hypothetical protein
LRVLVLRAPGANQRDVAAVTKRYSQAVYTQDFAAGVAQADSLTPLDARSHDTHSSASRTSTPMPLSSSSPRS